MNTAQKAQMQILQSTVSGAIAFSLSVKNDCALEDLRRVCEDILVANARPLYEIPLPSPLSEGRVHFPAVLDLNLPANSEDATVRQRRVRLEHLVLGRVDGTSVDIHMPGSQLTAAAEVIHCCLRRLAARSFPARVIGSEDFCDVGEPLGALTTASAGVAGCGGGRGDAASLLKSSIVSASFCGSGGSDGKA